MSRKENTNKEDKWWLCFQFWDCCLFMLFGCTKIKSPNCTELPFPWKMENHRKRQKTKARIYFPGHGYVCFWEKTTIEWLLLELNPLDSACRGSPSETCLMRAQYYDHYHYLYISNAVITVGSRWQAQTNEKEESRESLTPQGSLLCA